MNVPNAVLDVMFWLVVLVVLTPIGIVTSMLLNRAIKDCEADAAEDRESFDLRPREVQELDRLAIAEADRKQRRETGPVINTRR